MPMDSGKPSRYPGGCESEGGVVDVVHLLKFLWIDPENHASLPS